jgi:hypothetical protein
MASSSRPRPRRRRSFAIAIATLVTAIVTPAFLWHGLVSDIATRFRWDFTYFVSEWTPWFLLAGGIVFLAPVAFSAGRASEGRFNPRVRRAYFGWGVVLYLLGLLLATQVAQIAALSH